MSTEKFTAKFAMEKKVEIATKMDQDLEHNRRSMDHIEKNHMLQGKQGIVKVFSLLRTEGLCVVWALIQETLINPDAISAHRSKKDRLIYKKNFASPVGVNGLSGTLCHAVTVIYGTRNNYVVTAFPSVYK